VSARDDMKQAAARAAIAELPADGIVGIGTGSTVRFFIDALGELVASGRRVVGVATSERSRQHAQSLGVVVLDDDGPWDIAVCVDGADEVSAERDMIKGGGGAHAREKIVNYSARRNVIVVDEDKLSPKLGEKWSVPIEVLTFGHAATAVHLAVHGTPVLRRRDNAIARTDAGNVIYDVACGTIVDPRALDLKLRAIPGVVETGLFVGRADLVIVATPNGVRRI
jgi:ribose 5-phosphate isomerase A